MTGGIQAVAPSRKVSLFTTAGVVLPIERRRVSIKPFQYAPTASIDPGSSHPTGRQHLRWFEHRLPRLLLFVERLTVLLQGCYPSNKRGQVKQKLRMGRQMAVCSALVLSIGLIYHAWLVTGISILSFIFTRKPMPLTLSCQSQIARASLRW